MRSTHGYLRLLCLLFLPATWLWSTPGDAAADVTPTAQTGIAVEGQLGGPIKDLAVQGSTVFLAVGPRVQIVDAANPAAPHALAQTPLLPGDVQHIGLTGATLDDGGTISRQPPFGVLITVQPNCLRCWQS